MLLTGGLVRCLTAATSQALRITALQSGAAMSYYAVARGLNVGIYRTWNECEEQVKGVKGAKYRKFRTIDEANRFLLDNGCQSNPFSATTDACDSQLSDKVDDFLRQRGIGSGKRRRRSVNRLKEQCRDETSSKEVKDFWPEYAKDANEIEVNADLHSAMDAVNETAGTEERAKSHKRIKLMNETAMEKVKLHESKVWKPVGKQQFGRYEFLVDCEGYVIVYTDGSCLNNGKPEACAGFGVYFDDNHPLNTAQPVTGRPTNNVGEIQAAIYAVETCRHVGIRRLCISTDSQFMINAINVWIDNWKRNGWRTKEGNPVKNEIDFKRLDKVLSHRGLIIKWSYVRAHHGIKGNEMADQFARDGAMMYRNLHSKCFPNI